MTGIKTVENAGGKRACVAKVSNGECNTKTVGENTVVVPFLDKDGGTADVPAVVLEKKRFAPPRLANSAMPGEKFAFLGDLVGELAELGESPALVKLV